MATSITHKTQVTLNVWKRNIVEKVGGMLTVPRTEIAEELGIAVRKVYCMDGQI